MIRRLMSSGSHFEKIAAYSRAVIDGDMCFMSGTTGYDYATMVMPEDIDTQTKNTLATLGEVLDEADFSMADIVRANIIITDATYADIVFSVFGQTFKDIRPAATLIVAGLLRPEIKIEIEVTARRIKF